jgi:hypothetical protein
VLTDDGKHFDAFRSAVIWVMGVSTYTPNYHVQHLPTNPWIHQPFEDDDILRPTALWACYKQ